MDIRTRSSHLIFAAIGYLIMVSACVYSCSAPAATLPISEAKDNATSYRYISEAVQAALDSISLDAPIEFGGSIVECAGRGGYSYTAAATQDQMLAVSFETKVPKSWGACRIAARYHSHPATAPYGEYFSPGDIATAISENIPVYLLVARTGQMKVFRPGVTHTQVLTISGHLIRVSLGEKL